MHFYGINIRAIHKILPIIQIVILLWFTFLADKNVTIKYRDLYLEL